MHFSLGWLHRTRSQAVPERILNDITIRSKVECGLAGIRDLRTNAREDRMESFVLSETLKVGISGLLWKVTYPAVPVSLFIV